MSNIQDTVAIAVRIVKYSGDCMYARIVHKENLYCSRSCPIVEQCADIHRNYHGNVDIINSKKAEAAELHILNYPCLKAEVK